QQAAALLQAVYLDDRPAFNRLWDWTRAQLQTRPGGLLAGRWGEREDGSWGLLEARSRSEADQTAALALLFAARRWGGPSYAGEARALLASIWREETISLNGQRLLLDGRWLTDRVDAPPGPPTVDLDHLAPATYRVFALADPERPWLELVDSTYRLIDQFG